MWRAESLKAGAGSRSKAAKPCPPPPSSVCYHAVSAWWVSEREEKREGGWRVGSVLSPWEPKTWCNRCRPSCCALAFPCFSKLLLPLPHCHCGAKRLFKEPDETRLHGIWAILPCSSQCMLLPPLPDLKSLDKTSHSAPAAHRFPLLHKASHAVGDCWVKKSVFAGCLLLLHGFGVALKSFPLACRSRRPSVFACHVSVFAGTASDL